ncbi:MAG: hypothetical protein E7678_07465 [Ruminococcaceae bacterium]|nr:hypothetical protein [Oscillospiraceae bacterium]
MEKNKKSGAALLMYALIAVSGVLAVVSFGVYYGICENSILLWIGIVCFMIVYHLWMRIIMGNVSKLFPISYDNFWFREKRFEKKLYELLHVKAWKNKLPTYNPELFDIKKYPLDEIALTMTKAEFDHWINQLISLFSILFSLIWGKPWIFITTAVAAMAFDGLFITIQRYNRPKVLKIHENKKRLTIRHKERKVK